jgi:hypothetical protein
VALCTFARVRCRQWRASLRRMVALQRTAAKTAMGTLTLVARVVAGVSQCTPKLTPVAIGGRGCRHLAARVGACGRRARGLLALFTWTRTPTRGTSAYAIFKWERPLPKPTSRTKASTSSSTLWKPMRCPPAGRQRSGGGLLLWRCLAARCPSAATTAPAPTKPLLLLLVSACFLGTMAA